MRVDGWQPVDAPAGLATWLSAHAPALPTAPWMPFALHLCWAVVLAWLAVASSGKLPLVVRRVLGSAVLLWTLLPGEWSPAHVLGLVWQSPSLVTVLLCGSGLVMRSGWAPAGMRVATEDCTRPAIAWGVLGIVLGWALLLDTFALLPLELYAEGFAPAGVALALLGLGLPWVVWGGAPTRVALCLTLALVVYAVLRLPTGNVWDALLDPLLWLWLQARGPWQLLRYFLSRRAAPPATRA